MSWRDDLGRVTINGRNLVGASFRGVPFFVEEAERSGGRRAVVHEFPLRDDPYVEDLGRKARTFPVKGYVLGDDYLDQRDALITALENTPGPGELAHPYYGIRRAICTSWSGSDKRDEGGICTISIEFTETPAQAPVPTQVVAPADQVSTAADTSFDASKSELASKYDTTGMPAFSLDSAQTALTKASDALTAKLAPIVSDTQELANLTGQLALLTTEASSLVRTPTSTLDQFHTAITDLVNTAAAVPGDMMDALLDAYDTFVADFGTPVVATTSTRTKELANQTALVNALARAVVIEAARLAPLVPFVSMNDALAARDRIGDALEAQAEAADDTAYPALVDLRSQVLRAVPGSSAFAAVVTVTRPVAIPSLLLAYQLYGAVDLEADIIARNDIRHPGFIFGDVKVLSDG